MCPLIALACVSQQVVARTPAQQSRNAMTAVGFEPTPFRTGALSQRLRPLGQTVSYSLRVRLGHGLLRLEEEVTGLPRKCIVCLCTHRGARTHDHKVKSLALCRLS